MEKYFTNLENLVYHFFRQLWLVLGVKLMEINSNWFSRNLDFPEIFRDFIPIGLWSWGMRFHKFKPSKTLPKLLGGAHHRWPVDIGAPEVGHATILERSRRWRRHPVERPDDFFFGRRFVSRDGKHLLYIDPRDPITLSEDDWGLQSPPQQGI